MNQSVLHADVILRDRARERDAHVAEGLVLRALDATNTGKLYGRETAAVGCGAGLSGVSARIGQLWRGVRLPAAPVAQRPLCPDSPL